MILPYMLRLLCLCFASFFLIHTVLGLAVWALASGAIRAGRAVRPRTGARFLLVLRLLPVTLAAFVVMGLCIPSYLWLEPNAQTERVGLACCVMALLGALTCGISLIRTGRALRISLAHGRRCEREGRLQGVGGHTLPVTILNSCAPVLALTGVIRPRVVVSRGVVEGLPPEELSAALDHERAHHESRDNLKRLLLFLAPEVFPFCRTFARLDSSWSAIAEWSADDEATGGDSRRSLSLAAALVRLAQMGTAPEMSPLASLLVTNDRELSARVDRLLGFAPVPENPPRNMRALLRAGAVTITCAAIAVIIHPGTLYSVHRLLETLIR